MHIPDTFLNLPVLASTNVVSLGMMIYSLKKLGKRTPPERIPLMGLAAAFVFTVQLLSFPVLGGTSVHISGALLISLLLGPFTGFIIVASTLILQALLFQHGGLLTLGANILNIAMIQCFLGYFLYRFFPSKKIPVKIAFSAILVKMISSLFCAIELVLSESLPLNIGIISMVGAHFLAGIIEAVVTWSAIKMIEKIRPSLVQLEKT